MPKNRFKRSKGRIRALRRLNARRKAAGTGWALTNEYHHLGMPTTRPKLGETHLEEYKAFCTDHERNLFGIQWMRFEPDCPLPGLVKKVPHLAFEVDNLARALEGQEILIEPSSPSQGVLVAFVVCDGVPVELLEFSKK